LPKVFIINKGCHDFSDAKRFGHLIFMTEGTINRYAVSIIFRKFWKYLEKSSPEDYLLVTGMSTMLVVASAILAAKHKKLNLLLFKKGHYLERTIVMEEG